MQEMAASMAQMGDVAQAFTQMMDGLAFQFGKDKPTSRRSQKNLNQRSEIIYIPLTGLLPH